MAREPEVVAIGEFGLDYFRMLSPRDVQRAVFCAHLELARTHNLPCIIHVRDSHDDVVELLRTHGKDCEAFFTVFPAHSGPGRRMPDLRRLHALICWPSDERGQRIAPGCKHSAVRENAGRDR